VGVVRLLGQDIAYSASPAMQSAAFSVLGLDHRYELLDVTAAALPDAVAALRDARFLGANVTVSHKEAALGLVDESDPMAVEARAINTIVARGGRLVGSNTDVPALADEIKRLRPEPQNAVILGAGGAARAVKLALNRAGAKQTTLVSRSGLDGAVPWQELPHLIADADLLINATPVGTNSGESPVDPGLLHRGLAVLDLVYRPSPTRLVHDARARGLPARAGAGVLLGQGWRSLEAWLSTTAPESAKRAMADALCRELGAGADV
jgi:shikimate dehydrogenase